MTAQLHQALSIMQGRTWTDQDQAILREVELAKETARRRRRRGRHRR